MTVSEIERTRQDCIKCGACTKNCKFLEKYSMNLLDFCDREDLRYSCFMCDRCKEVCPKDLSGRQIALELRQNNPKGLGSVEFMKNNYKLRNNSKKPSETLLFLGCNYPGFLPKTSERMIEICAEHGVDFSVDCCKKPVAEMGGDPKMKYIDKVFRDKGVKRLICCCPNCYHFLKDRYDDIEIIDPYEYLLEIGEGRTIEEEAHVFFPCSERFDSPIFENIKKFAPNVKTRTYKKINCCGMGGGASKTEGQIKTDWHQDIKDIDADNIYNYCSTCAGVFEASGIKNVKVFLSEILGVNERPSQSYGKNVLKIKFRNHKM